jgi:hypothetical protein
MLGPHADEAPSREVEHDVRRGGQLRLGPVEEDERLDGWERGASGLRLEFGKGGVLR